MTFARGRNVAMNRREPTAGSGIVTPSSILLSSPPLVWLRSDLGITIGTGVSAWADQSTGHAANNFTQGTAGSQMVYSASDATLNNRPSLTADGIDDFLVCAGLTLGVNTWIWLIAKQIGWTAAAGMVGQNASATNSMVIQQQTGSPQLRQNNGAGANVNGAGTLGSWFRVESYFSSSGSDFLKVGATPISGGNAGPNTVSTGYRLASINAANFFSGAFAEVVICANQPTGGESTAMTAYGTSLYGASLF